MVGDCCSKRGSLWAGGPESHILPPRKRPWSAAIGPGINAPDDESIEVTAPATKHVQLHPTPSPEPDSDVVVASVRPSSSMNLTL